MVRVIKSTKVRRQRKFNTGVKRFLAGKQYLWLAVIVIVVSSIAFYYSKFASAVSVNKELITPIADSRLDSTTTWANWHEFVSEGWITATPDNTEQWYYNTSPDSEFVDVGNGSWKTFKSNSSVQNSVYMWHEFDVPKEFNPSIDTIKISFWCKRVITGDINFSNVKWKITNADGTNIVASGTADPSAPDWTQVEQSVSNLNPNTKYRFYIEHEADVGSGSVQVNFDIPRVTLTYSQEPIVGSVSSALAYIPNDNKTSTTVVATVYDRYNTPLTNTQVTFSAGKGVFGSVYGSNSTTVTTDVYGKASVKYFSGTDNNQGGPVTITAEAGSSQNQTIVNILYPNTIEITADEKTVADNQSAIISAYVKDQRGNPLPNAEINFSKTPDSGGFSPVPDEGGTTSQTISAITDETGIAKVSFKSNVGGEYTITASDTNERATGTTKVTVQEASHISVSVSKKVIKSTNGFNEDTITKVTAYLTDQSGMPMSNEEISFSCSPSGGIFTSSTVNTDSKGIAVTNFSSNVGATYTITAKLNRKASLFASDTVKVQAPKEIIVTSEHSDIPNNDIVTTKITAKLVDQVDQPISGEIINFSTNLGYFTTAATGTTNAAGEVVLQLKSTASGTATITATLAQDENIQGSAIVNIYNPEPTTISLDASPGNIPDDNYITSTATAVVKDQKGFPVVGQTVNFSLSPANAGTFTNSTSSISDTTDTDGRATATFKSGTAGNLNVTASSGSASANANVTVVKREAKSVQLTATPNLIPNNNSTTTVIKAHVLDQFDRPFNGKEVSFSIISGTGILSDLTANTNSVGDATVTFKSPSKGTVTIRGEADNVYGTAKVYVESRVPTTLTLSASPNTVVSNGEISPTITAHLTDQFGAPMSGYKINFVSVWGNLSQSFAVTDVNGNVSVKMSAASRPGITSITASVDLIPIVTGITTVEFIDPDNTPPRLLNAEATSKQIIYLTFDERIELNTPLNWNIERIVGSTVYSMYSDTYNVEVLNNDQRIVKITLSSNMDKGNNYPDQTKYRLTVSNVTDLSGNAIDDNYKTVEWAAFSPHGKYSPYGNTSNSSVRICATCHQGHKAKAKNMLTQNSISGLCFVCHGYTGPSYNVAEEFDNGSSVGEASMHKAIDSKSDSDLTCADCHDPHGIKKSGTNDVWPKLLAARDPENPDKFITSEDGNKFCLACHGSQSANVVYDNRLGDYWVNTLGDHSKGMNQEGGKYFAVHYDSGFSALNPPSGTNITCTQCHEPHGSKNAGLIDNNITNSSGNDNDKDLCYKCHDSASNSISSVNIKNQFEQTGSKHDITSSSVGLGCRSCHEPHSVSNTKFADSSSDKPSDISDPLNTKENWNKSSGSGRISEFCIRCHNKDSGLVVEKLMTTSTIVPFSVYLPEANFSGPGWNKSDYNNSAHYQNNIECTECHEPHGSEYDRLLTRPEDQQSGDLTEGICLKCHSGNGSAPDVYHNGFDQTYTHPTLSKNSEHSDTEDYSNLSTRHAECYDCHDPHTANSSNKLGDVTGIKYSVTSWSKWDSSADADKVNLGGSDPIQAYLCYKCHSKYSFNGTPPAGETDVAKELNPANSARHVVEGSSEMPEFTYNSDTYYYGKYKNGWTADSNMKCTDCHSKDGNSGPHGTEYQGILRAPWNSQTGTDGSDNYLCFKCHEYSFYAGSNSGSETSRSQFSNGTNYNLHSIGGHSDAGCSSCHGNIPHGWNKKDDDGGGLSLNITSDPSPYSVGVKITSINSNTVPGVWQKASCDTVTGCHHN